MLDGQIVNSRIIVDTTVAFTRVQRASKCGRELSNEAMVWKTKVSKFEGESDKVSDTNSMLVYATRAWGNVQTHKSGAWMRPSTKTAR